jgi:hypothetical protein
MKLTTIVLAAVSALSSTFALADTPHHRTYHHYHHHYYHGTVGMGGAMNRTNQGTVGMGRSINGPNSRGGLVGGSDSGTYRP